MYAYMITYSVKRSLFSENEKFNLYTNLEFVDASRLENEVGLLIFPNTKSMKENL